MFSKTFNLPGEFLFDDLLKEWSNGVSGLEGIPLLTSPPTDPLGPALSDPPPPLVGCSPFSGLSGRVFLTRIWDDSLSRVISPVLWSMMSTQSFLLASLVWPLEEKIYWGHDSLCRKYSDERSSSICAARNEM